MPDLNVLVDQAGSYGPDDMPKLERVCTRPRRRDAALTDILTERR